MGCVITIDGPAGSGKSTVSRNLAQKINYFYLDTGAMYRAVALAANRKGIPLDHGPELKKLCETMNIRFLDEQGAPRLFLDKEDISTAIRSPEMDMRASKVSSAKEVREAMVVLQRRLAKGKNVVAEGRDMGTVVFFDALYKFYLTASLEVRAERRFKERIARGEPVQMVDVLAQLRKRDSQDETRSVAPLKPAEDAEIIDSTDLSADEVVGIIIDFLNVGHGASDVPNK